MISSLFKRQGFSLDARSRRVDIQQMLELEDAVGRILSQVAPLPGESVPLHEATGRYVSEKVLSPHDLPLFDNSAMDGYAVRSSDVSAASCDTPISLQLSGMIAAGSDAKLEVTPGSCVRIYTGSPLPAGADAVVMQEDTKVDPSDVARILVTDIVKAWENVRFRGEDVKAGSALAEPGDKLTVPRSALLAAAGVSSIKLSRKPIVGILATGSELIEAPHSPEPGKIFESNRIGLAGFVTACGARPVVYPLVKDTLEETRRAIEIAFNECDAVITSGGVSVGDFDFVKRAFEDLGGKLCFWKVAIKPGKPFVLGELKTKLLFGLPGNPVSALVTFFLLVRPALLRMQGAGSIAAPMVSATLTESLQNRGDRRHFIRVRVDEHGRAHPTGIQASHILSSLALANGLLEVPPNSSLSAGASVQVIRWD